MPRAVVVATAMMAVACHGFTPLVRPSLVRMSTSDNSLFARGTARSPAELLSSPLPSRSAVVRYAATEAAESSSSKGPLGKLVSAMVGCVKLVFTVVTFLPLLMRRVLLKSDNDKKDSPADVKAAVVEEVVEVAAVEKVVVEAPAEMKPKKASPPKRTANPIFEKKQSAAKQKTSTTASKNDGAEKEAPKETPKKKKGRSMPKFGKVKRTPTPSAKASAKATDDVKTDLSEKIFAWQKEKFGM